MYELMIKDSFAAAHNLRDYSGKCEHLHGHNYTVELHVRAEQLMPNGLAIDFTDLKKVLKKVMEVLDHKYLNEDVEYFKINNPSAENIAKFVFDELEPSIKPAKVFRVCVYESENAKACYYK